MTGGFRVNGGMQVRLGSANAAGSSRIVNPTSIGIIEFTGNSDGARSVPNDIVGSATTSKTLISNAKTDAAVTLSGKIISAGGLTFQGYDNAGAVSETVLSGTISVSGVPDIYSYGDGTTQRRFVNAQSGINLGVTKYQTTTALAFGTAGFLAYAGGTTTPVENGAEGYVRFDGANSFIPGAVGPGYLAALRKGGADPKEFGYLLTQNATAYTLPEGKSFVIGTLGTGTAQTGTFGVKGAAGTATFLGSRKAALGQLLAGSPGGDINIHGNAAAADATLNLLADTGTTLVLGSGTATENVVFTPTYGDSGATSAITLMAKRTGATTLNKIGTGTLEVKGVNFTHTDGDDARSTMTINVNAGTLKYSQADTGDPYAALTVGANGTFKPTDGSLLKVNQLTLTTGAMLDVSGLTTTSGTITLIQGSNPVVGTFANANGQVTIGSATYTISYAGNNVTLTRFNGTQIMISDGTRPGNGGSAKSIDVGRTLVSGTAKVTRT